MSRERLSTDSLNEATRERAHFSGHGDAKGAEGAHGETAGSEGNGFLTEPGQTAIANPQEFGFRDIRIGMQWGRREAAAESQGLLHKLVEGMTGHAGSAVDLDLGCLYELQSGERGAIQAFGDLFGKFDEAPFITLSGDDRTGDKEGRRRIPDRQRQALAADQARAALRLYLPRGA